MTIFTKTTVFFNLPEEEEEHEAFHEQMGEEWRMDVKTSYCVIYVKTTRVWRTNKSVSDITETSDKV